MPVAIEYQPVGAIAAAAQDSASARWAEQQNQLFEQSAQRQSNAAYQNADLAQRDRQYQGEQQYRYADLAQRGQEADQRNQQAQDELQFRYDQEADKSPQAFTDDAGNQLELKPDQLSAVRNLSQVEEPGSDAYNEGLRKIMGLPPTSMVDYKTPTGETLRVTPAQAATYQQRDAALTQRADQAQQRDTERQAAHADLVDIRQQGLDLRRELALSQARNADTKTLSAQQKALDENDDKEQLAAEKAAGLEVRRAIDSAKAYVTEKGASLQADDPELQRRNGIAQGMIGAEAELVRQGMVKKAERSKRMAAAMQPPAPPVAAPATPDKTTSSASQPATDTPKFIRDDPAVETSSSPTDAGGRTYYKSIYDLNDPGHHGAMVDQLEISKEEYDQLNMARAAKRHGVDQIPVGATDVRRNPTTGAWEFKVGGKIVDVNGKPL